MGGADRAVEREGLIEQWSGRGCRVVGWEGLIEQWSGRG